MRHLFVIILVVIGVIAPSTVGAQDVSAPAGPATAVVTGDGLVRRAPDQARVRIGSDARSPRPAEAQAAAATAMTAVQAQLLSLGLGKDALRTLIVSLQQEFDYANGQQKPRGYLARNVIEVRVDDLSRLAEVLDLSVGAGATTLFGLEFDLRDRAAAEREALRLAVVDAMARAEALAAGARRTVDRLLRIEESRAGVMPIRQQMADRVNMQLSTATPVSEGEIEVRASVVVTVTLK